MTRQEIERRFTKPQGWLWGAFTGARGAPLRFGSLRLHKAPAAHIVYIEGLSEYAEKTFEIARDFNDRACNFSVFDRHGQGQSARYFPSRPHKQHSDGMERDAADIVRFCRDHIPPGEPVVLLGHSTGGLLALLALAREPELFCGAILTAPLLGIRENRVRGREGFIARLPLPRILARLYAPGGTDWKARSDPSAFLPPGAFSSDPVRQTIDDRMTTHDPALRTGSVTLGWVMAACRAIVKVRDPAFSAKITQPLLVFTAGEDLLVVNEETEAVLRALPHAAHVHYPDSRHEMLMERDGIREALLEEAARFVRGLRRQRADCGRSRLSPG